MFYRHSLFIHRHSPIFHLPYFSLTSFNDSPHKTRCSTYNSSINEASLTSSVRTLITTANKTGLKPDLDGHQLSQKMNLIVPRQLRQQFYSLYKKTSTKHSRTPFRLKAKQILSLAPDQKLFPGQQI